MDNSSLSSILDNLRIESLNLSDETKAFIIIFYHVLNNYSNGTNYDREASMEKLCKTLREFNPKSWCNLQSKRFETLLKESSFEKVLEVLEKGTNKKAPKRKSDENILSIIGSFYETESLDLITELNLKFSFNEREIIFFLKEVRTLESLYLLSFYSRFVVQYEYDKANPNITKKDETNDDTSGNTKGTLEDLLLLIFAALAVTVAGPLIVFFLINYTSWNHTNPRQPSVYVQPK